MKTLTVIGCGRVGKTLARLWGQSRVFEICDLFDHKLGNAEACVRFAGAGRAVADYGELRPADLWLIASPDRHIVSCCEALAKADVLRGGNIVFHCSGAMPSRDLGPAKELGAFIAGVHPLKSFADPGLAAQTFSGTYCALEGDAEALDILGQAVGQIGGKAIAIDPEFKTVYHAAGVIVCNYLTALLEIGLRCYERAGLSRETALQVIEPLVRETVDNVFTLGTVRALTGPVARGDFPVIARQIQALAGWDRSVGDIYQRLGAVALELSRAQGSASREALDRIAEILKV